MPIKANYDTKSKPKFFTGGKPKDFDLTTASGKAALSMRLAADGKSYTITANGSACQKGIREFGEHLVELADIMEGKIAA